MSRGGIASEPLAVVAGPPTDELREELDGWGCAWIVMGDGSTAAPDATLAERTVLWLGPRARVSTELREATENFAAGSVARVAVAPHVACDASLCVPLGDRLILSAPASAGFGPLGPCARPGIPSMRLEHTVEVRLPLSVGAHLDSVNEQSSAYASWGSSLGVEPSWQALAWAPAQATARGWWGARGARGRAFTAAFLEGFLWSATTAKLWEVRHPETEPPA